jgi:starch synthase
MPAGRKKPRILIVTPEITYLPKGMGNMAQRMNAKAGGLADVSASLVAALFAQDADVHVALPNYRRMFNMDVFDYVEGELRLYHSKLPKERIHLAEDRLFYYRDQVYSSYEGENPRVSMVFQREVINNIIPHVRPDLIHCNDWMTGLIPAYARRMGIPCLFTVHNIHTEKVSLEQIEETGIDAAEFWNGLYFEKPPHSYEESRQHNRIDMLASGIFASHYINSVSPSFLKEVVEGEHLFVPDAVRQELSGKFYSGCGVGVLNAPDSSYDPRVDKALSVNYGEKDHSAGKAANKRAFQEKTGLNVDSDAPILFWPSRLDPIQKGCELVTDILFQIVSDYAHTGLQVAVVANGEHQFFFHEIVKLHDLGGRVCVCDFSESLSRLGYAAADFMLMPSRFEPCGLPQMVSAIYGTLPIVHATGGLKDTVSHLSMDTASGNGFSFDHYSKEGLRWAVDEALRFYSAPAEVRSEHIERIMLDGRERFNHDACAQAYIKIYEDMLERPLLPVN